MRAIAIINQKGGVAKTMTTAAVADILSLDHKKRVLVGDADPQGNLSQYFGIDTKHCSTMLELLRGEIEPYWEDFICLSRNGISIIPSDMRLIASDIDAIQRKRCNLAAIADIRTVLEEDDAFDYFLVDCPASLSFAVQATLMAVDAVIIPISLDYFSENGMDSLAEQVKNMREINPRLRVAGVLVTKYMGTDEERKACQTIANSGMMPVYETRIRFSRLVSTATYNEKPLVQFSSRCAASVDYRRFVREFLSREEGRGNER